MLNYNQVTNSEINNNGVSVKEIAPIMKLNLRGKTREFFTNVGKSLNMILPTPDFPSNIELTNTPPLLFNNSNCISVQSQPVSRATQK